MFRVTDVTVPPIDMASEEVKKLKDTLQRGLTDEQVAQYVDEDRIRASAPVSIRPPSRQVTGANN